MPIAQRQREVQGPRDRQQERRLVPPPGDRGRRGHAPGARRGQGLRRRPLGPVVAGAVAQRHAVHERREPRPVRRDHRQLVGRQQHVQRRLHDEGRHRRQRAGRVQGLHQQRRRLRRAARRQRLDAHLAGAGRRPLWYQDLLGGLFVSHPANAERLRHRLRLLLLGRGRHRGPLASVHGRLRQADARSRSRTSSTTSTASRGRTSTRCMLLNEATYVGAIGVGTNAGNIEGGDHPIAWCSNFDGGREWSQVLGHNWELFRTTPWFRESIYQGILTAAGPEAGQLRHARRGQDAAGLAAAPPAGSPPPPRRPAPPRSTRRSPST